MVIKSVSILDDIRVNLKNQIDNINVENYQTSKLVVVITTNCIYKPLDESKIIDIINTLCNDNNTPISDTYISLIALGNEYTVLIEPTSLKYSNLLIEYLNCMYMITPCSMLNCNVLELIDQIKNRNTTSNKINQFSNVSTINLT